MIANAQPPPQHTSFDATVFDLNPNLPVESVQPSASSDLQQQQQSSTDQTSLVNAKTEIDSVSLSKSNADNELVNNNRAWFRDHYNISGCPKSERYIGEQFQKKFPPILSASGKDQELAGLITSRLIICRRKTANRHWDKIYRLLAKNATTALSSREVSDCRDGVVQERIACINLDNYACQFIDADYAFKLLPARLVVQEARQAENGADKCRALIELLKKQKRSRAKQLQQQ